MVAMSLNYSEQVCTLCLNTVSILRIEPYISYSLFFLSIKLYLNYGHFATSMQQFIEASGAYFKGPL